MADCYEHTNKTSGFIRFEKLYYLTLTDLRVRMQTHVKISQLIEFYVFHTVH